ncbi:Nmad3 family putative nucleotide modification protein [Thalassobacillus hwangdonensis]|uniref:Nucleotide modification associated domain-containing protein n=1 Tax=Thalassobacillus hwangdonensis TaxID=546108 RepID=A0ABW3L3N2_9BACI
MEKLILSRKGFDSSAGYGYSPFDPETGKYIVLPIPEDEAKDSGYTFEELKVINNYLEGMRAANLKELIKDPKMGYSKKSIQVIENSHAHYDPVLGIPPWLKNGPKFGAFGQSEAAAGHLRNNGVGEGSIFLFFSRFKPMKNRVHPLDPRASWTDGAYFLYGWLKVGKVITKENQNELPSAVKEKHPHGSAVDFRNRENNTIYLAADKLFDDHDIPGCGYFPRLTNKLLLSSEAHKNKPSIWKLPSFFHEEEFLPTYLNVPDKLENRWFLCPDESESCFVQTTGRGQEYVSSLKGKSLNWLRSLFDI